MTNEKLVRVEITYENLFKKLNIDKIGTYENEKEIYVQTPNNEYVKVNGFVKKDVETLIRVTTKKGRTFECSKNHLFMNEKGNSVLAKEAYKIQTIDGIDRIVEYSEIAAESPYDISIPAPHWYVGHNGIIHHNTFFAFSIIKTFLDAKPNSRVLYFDTEFALDREFFAKRDIDPNRVFIIQPETLQDFRTKSLKFLDAYETQKKKDPILIVLDSLGNLPTVKEVADSTAGSDTRDMTKAQIIKSIFRVLTSKIGKMGIPFICTNHVYASIGCLDSLQFLQMANETNKQIIDIKIGDEVKVLGGTSKITDLFEYDIEEYYEMILESGEVIKATPNHKFMTVSGDWKRIDELLETDELLTV